MEMNIFMAVSADIIDDSKAATTKTSSHIDEV
jgi:hypothetical protein